MPIEIPFSAACDRNKKYILKTIFPYLKHADTVLEIGTGTAQHAVHFAKALPKLMWQTSDQASYHQGIHAQLKNAELSNIVDPLVLDVNQDVWTKTGERYSVIFTANTLHIMNWESVKMFFSGLPKVSNDKAKLIVYGPFKYQGKFTSDSNQAFDQTLRESDWGYAIPNFEDIDTLANKAGFRLLEDVPMPANNQCLIFQK